MHVCLDVLSQHRLTCAGALLAQTIVAWEQQAHLVVLCSLVPKRACPQSTAIANLSNVAVVTGGFRADTAEDFDVSKRFKMISIAVSNTGLRSQKELC